jgi:hypothetical protein
MEKRNKQENTFAMKIVPIWIVSDVFLFLVYTHLAGSEIGMQTVPDMLVHFPCKLLVIWIAVIDSAEIAPKVESPVDAGRSRNRKISERTLQIVWSDRLKLCERIEQ